MSRRSFTVRAVWDEDARVYYSESDILGLHIEAPTLDEFEAIMMEVAPELVVENHLSRPDLASKSLSDLIPTIVWQKPSPVSA
jgi:hypothetical protein